MPRLSAALTSLASILVVATACAAPAPPTAPPITATAASKPAAPTTGAAANAKEVDYVRGPRQLIVATIDALRKGEVASARRAMSDYDSAWNGIEVYVNVRSRELYNAIEVQDQQQIEKLLEGARPSAAEILPVAEDMLAKYDQAIKLSEAGPALSPLFDDVTALRIVRAELRKIGPALKAGDLAGARAAYDAFERRWDEVEALIKLRSPGTRREVEEAMKRAGPALRAAQPNPAEAGPLVDALIERYNVGLALVNAAARGADVAKTTYTADDVNAATALGQIEAELRASLPLWEAGKLPAAGEHARRAANELFDGAAGPLKTKSADAGLKRALDGYAGVADKAGDGAKVRAANRSALEAVAVAQQSLVGQFWTEPRLRGALVTGLLTALRDEVARAAGQSGDGQALRVASAWGALQVADDGFRGVEGALKATAPDEAEAAGKALGTLKGLLPDPSNAPAPSADAVGQAVEAATSALKAGLSRP